MAAADIDFVMEKTLGEGAFGKVYLVTDKNNSSEKYAMKVIDLKKSPPDERELALKEARLLSDFHHENILKYVESFEDNGALCIVTEFCDQGDLAEYLEKRSKKALPEIRIIEWFREICSALEYLHGRRVLHRDIKTQNVFLTGCKQTAKLGDLGLAKVLERPNAKAVTFCGSPYYMSPELFACKPYDDKSDIWALGVCVYEMATLERPFDAMLMQQLVFKIVHGKLPEMPDDKYSPELITLMKKMLDKSSETRPSAADLLKDPIFQITQRPKTPPPLPQKPAKSEASNKNINRSNVSMRLREAMKKMDESNRTAYDIGTLMESLNITHKQRQQGFKPQLSTKQEMGAMSVMTSIYVSDKLMANTYSDKKLEKNLGPKSLKGMTLKGEKTLTAESMEKDKTLTESDINISLKTTRKTPPPGGAVGGNTKSNEDCDFVNKREHSDSDSEESGAVGGISRSPAEMLQRVVRTLTQFKDQDEGHLRLRKMDSQNMDQETLLLYQIEQLQQHCVRVLGRDIQKFRRAYDLLDQTDNDAELEEKLIKMLTPEVFGACGVQLFYCKNFEYNLQKLQDPRGKSEV